MPGSALGCKTLDLLRAHGFPADKRLGAGVVDGRSVWADGDAPAALLAAIKAQVGRGRCQAQGRGRVLMRSPSHSSLHCVVMTLLCFKLKPAAQVVVALKTSR